MGGGIVVIPGEKERPDEAPPAKKVAFASAGGRAQRPAMVALSYGGNNFCSKYSV